MKVLRGFLGIFSFFLMSSIMIIPSALAISESHYFEKYQNRVLPYFDEGVQGSFTGQDQVEIAYRAFEVEDEKAALVILPGRGEPIQKYAELIYDLRNLDFSIYIMEHRGQGESGQVAKA